MQLNLRHVFTDRKGTAIVTTGADVLTLEEVCYNSLTTLFPDEQQLSGADKLKRGRLAQRIVSAPSGLLDVRAEEVAMLKLCIGKAYNSWIIVQAEDLLDPQPQTDGADI